MLYVSIKNCILHYQGFIFIVFAILLSLAFALPVFYYPIYYDQATFYYVARIWEQGLLPFRDALDTKPVGIYALYALADFLFGQRESSYRFLEFLMFVSTLFPFRKIFHFLSLPMNWGILAYLLYGAFYYLGTTFANIGQVEMVLGILALWFLYYLLSTCQDEKKLRSQSRLEIFCKFYLAGIFGGLFFILKQPYGMISLLIFFPDFFIFQKTNNLSFLQALFGFPVRRAFLAIAFALGLTSVLLIIVSYFAFHGAVGDLFYGMFRLPILYAKYANLPATAFSDYYSMLLWNLPLLVLSLIGFWSLLHKRSIVAARLALFWSMAIVLSILVQKKFWPYHWISLLPVIALFLVLGLAYSFRWSQGFLISKFWFVCLGVFVILIELFFLAHGVYTVQSYALGKSNHWAGAIPNILQYQGGKISKEKYYSDFYGPFTRLDQDWAFSQAIQKYIDGNESLQIVEFRPMIYTDLQKFAPHKYFFGSIVFLVGPEEGQRLLGDYKKATYQMHRPDWIVFGLDGPWSGAAIEALRPEKYGYVRKGVFIATYHPHNALGQVHFGIYKNVLSKRNNEVYSRGK